MSASAPSRAAVSIPPSISVAFSIGSESTHQTKYPSRGLSFLKLKATLALLGVQRIATRERRGRASLISSSRFELRSVASKLSPVIFPPGRARLAIMPAPTRVTNRRHDDGNSTRGLQGGLNRFRPRSQNDLGLISDEFGRKRWKPIELPLSGSDVKSHIPICNPSELLHPVHECGQACPRLWIIWGCRDQKTPTRRILFELLRPRDERPCRCRTAYQAYEVAPPHGVLLVRGSHPTTPL